MAAPPSATSYAEKAAHDNTQLGKPIFVKNRDIPVNSNRDFAPTQEEFYKFLAKAVPKSDIKGIQRIGGLWRIYIDKRDLRVKLIMNGLGVRGVNVAVYDANPFVADGDENTVKVLVKDIPLSVHNSVITDELEKQKCKIRGKVVYQRLRVDGLLTDCLTGDRMIYIERPSFSLPRMMAFGLFKGRVYHPNQNVLDPDKVTCSNCLTTGHHRSRCSAPVVCKRCKSSGHYARDCPNPTPPTSPERRGRQQSPSHIAGNQERQHSHTHTTVTPTSSPHRGRSEQRQTDTHNIIASATSTDRGEHQQHSRNRNAATSYSLSTPDRNRARSRQNSPTPTTNPHTSRSPERDTSKERDAQPTPPLRTSPDRKDGKANQEKITKFLSQIRNNNRDRDQSADQSAGSQSDRGDTVTLTDRDVNKTPDRETQTHNSCEDSPNESGSNNEDSQSDYSEISAESPELRNRQKAEAAKRKLKPKSKRGKKK